MGNLVQLAHKRAVAGGARVTNWSKWEKILSIETAFVLRVVEKGRQEVS